MNKRKAEILLGNRLHAAREQYHHAREAWANGLHGGSEADTATARKIRERAKQAYLDALRQFADFVCDGVLPQG